ncbi:MAG: aminoacyl-histidine dipeptidase [Defluviitaleaceae bacterium]|nr:aminoacyl-histidine dipeptidase [Defluviitaleaceae bacterium]
MEHTVLKYFLEISKIPRGSGDEKAVSDFVANFARERGADVFQDESYNLVIKKRATQGRADKPSVILQAHLDMVCEKNADTAHDFTRDPLDTYIDGDFIKARGTTLGADNGIGVAMCMALLDADFDHPPLEILLTSDEEAGMSGAKNLDTLRLSGTRMINLDSSDETTFTMGCAAAVTAEVLICEKKQQKKDRSETFQIVVKGLKGGHSGGDIDLERGNAIRILGFLLNGISKTSKGTLAEGDVRIADISGGMKVNAIPREAVATVVFAGEEREKILVRLEKLRENFIEQFRVSEPELEISWDFAGDAPGEISSGESFSGESFSIEATQKIISALLLLPNGVSARSLEIDDLVNASCNIGVIETTDAGVKISLMARGATEFYTRQAETQISACASAIGAEIRFTQRSPAWAYNPSSALLKTAGNVYDRIFSTKPDSSELATTDTCPRAWRATAVHGGLECGIFMEKMPGLEIISFGPNMYDYHTPDERLSISSTLRVWEFLCELLREL